MTVSIPFQKMNGLGNEIVVVDLRGRRLKLDAATGRAFWIYRYTPAQDRVVCCGSNNRGLAILGDTLLMTLHEPKTIGTEAYVRIHNSDGSPAEACGNGMRCVGWQVAQQTGRNALKFETVAGVLDVSVQDRGRITVDMGKPRFGWREIPLAEAFQDTRAIELQTYWTRAPNDHTNRKERPHDFASRQQRSRHRRFTEPPA